MYEQKGLRPIGESAEQMELDLKNKLNSATGAGSRSNDTSALSETTTAAVTTSTCGECGELGFIHVVKGRHVGVIRCQCRSERVVAQKIARLPPRLQDMTLRNYVPCDGAQSRAFERLAGDVTHSFVLEGDYSRGKTHLAAAQYIELARLERSCLFFSMSELFLELRKAELDPGPDGYFCEVRERVHHGERFHLFIDDLDKFRVTDFRFESLFDLVNSIYTRKLGLTVTTNQSLREIRRRQLIDGAILRRIEDICEVLTL